LRAINDNPLMPELAFSRLIARPAHPHVEADSTGLAVVPLAMLACVVAVLLIAGAGGYGYHRDELYFLAAGRHLAWAYPDQGVLTPLIAHMMSSLFPGSLNALR